jgi:hypothetical protein
LVKCPSVKGLQKRDEKCFAGLCVYFFPLLEALAVFLFVCSLQALLDKGNSKTQKKKKKSRRKPKKKNWPNKVRTYIVIIFLPPLERQQQGALKLFKKKRRKYGRWPKWGR